jgi:hypothetical protein
MVSLLVYQEHSFLIKKCIIAMFTIGQCYKYHIGGCFDLATRRKCVDTAVYQCTVSRYIYIYVCVCVCVCVTYKYVIKLNIP